MGLWTAPSGQDASTEGAKMTLNSDLDHLQFHAQGTLVRNGQQVSPGLYVYDTITQTFPQIAANYYPLAFISASISTDKGIYYPPMWSNDAGGGDLAVMSVGGWNIYPDKLVFSGSGNYAQARISWWVFKNRIY
jgi:hypothetical protein